MEWALNLKSDLLIRMLWEDTEAHTEERSSCEGKGRDWGDASVSQGILRAADSKGGQERNTKQAFLRASRRNQPANTLILDFWSP